MSAYLGWEDDPVGKELAMNMRAWAWSPGDYVIKLSGVCTYNPSAGEVEAWGSVANQSNWTSEPQIQ